MTNFEDRLDEILKSWKPKAFWSVYSAVWILRNFKILFAIVNFDEVCNLNCRITFIDSYFETHNIWIGLLTNILYTLVILLISMISINIYKKLVDFNAKWIAPKINPIKNQYEIEIKLAKNIEADSLRKFSKERIKVIIENIINQNEIVPNTIINYFTTQNLASIKTEQADGKQSLRLTSLGMHYANLFYENKLFNEMNFYEYKLENASEIDKICKSLEKKYSVTVTYNVDKIIITDLLRRHPIPPFTETSSPSPRMLMAIYTFDKIKNKYRRNLITDSLGDAGAGFGTPEILTKIETDFKQEDIYLGE